MVGGGAVGSPWGPLSRLGSSGSAPPPWWAVCCQGPAGAGTPSVWGRAQVVWAEVGFSAPTHPWAGPGQALLEQLAGFLLFCHLGIL